MRDAGIGMPGGSRNANRSHIIEIGVAVATRSGGGGSTATVWGASPKRLPIPKSRIPPFVDVVAQPP